jgi:hypothetical protein
VLKVLVQPLQLSTTPTSIFRNPKNNCSVGTNAGDTFQKIQLLMRTGMLAKSNNKRHLHQVACSLTHFPSVNRAITASNTVVLSWDASVQPSVIVPVS